MSMRAGKLRHRIIIQQSTPSRDAVGAVVDSWSTFATVWAAIEPLTGKENYSGANQAIMAEADIRFRIRYREGLTRKMRVSWYSRLFDIQHIASVQEANKEIHLLCKEFEPV